MDYEDSLDYSEELNAVNDILAAIGEAPVNTLEGENNVDVANVRRILGNINREVQAKGWTFNIEQNVSLVPDILTQRIKFQQDFLKLTVQGAASPYIKRGENVYDTTARTDVFTSPITVDLIRLRTYDQMPECFRGLIVTKASRRFNMFFFGAAEVEAHLAETEQEHYQSCMEYELDFGQFNMLDGDAWVQGKLTR